MITIGDDSDKFYILLEGEASVLVPFIDQVKGENTKDSHFAVLKK